MPNVQMSGTPAPVPPGGVPEVDRLIPGQSPPMRHLQRLVRTVAPSDAPVLVVGPSGAGKELVAQAVHRLSGRAGACVAVNCAAIPGDLLEAELFGHDRGAFTGADRARTGLIAQAAGGTLFLDEIGDLPARLQAKLLRVLETRQVRPLGGTGAVTVDFRLVAATHRDLAAMAAAGTFREDLYFRLAVLPLGVPPLAARPGDLPVLLDRLLQGAAAARPAVALPCFDASALQVLAAHAWPGNVRELKTVVQRACLLFPGLRVSGEQVRDNLLVFSVPPEAAGDANPAAALPRPASPETDDGLRAVIEAGGAIDLRGHLRTLEARLVGAALDRHRGCVSRAAAALGLHRSTLIERLAKVRPRPAGPAQGSGAPCGNGTANRSAA